jgi:hypothetical protein
MDNNKSKEIAARKRVVRWMTISGSVIVLAMLAGVWSVVRHAEAVLIVTSRPAGAEVVLDYRPTNVLTNAFLSGLPADSMIVSVRRDGYRPVPPSQGVRLTPNDTTRVTFILAAISAEDSRELPPASGRPYRWAWRHVRMNSNPPGAEIVINDMNTKLLTPAEFLLEAGRYHLRAHWPNGAKAYKNISVDPAESHPDVLFQPATYVQPEVTGK